MVAQPNPSKRNSEVRKKTNDRNIRNIKKHYHGALRPLKKHEKIPSEGWAAQTTPLDSERILFKFFN
jgi:hypothetical protein